MDFWAKLGKFGQRLIIISGIIGSLTVITVTARKPVDRWLEKKRAERGEQLQGIRDDIQDLKNEDTTLWAVVTSIHYDQRQQGQLLEMVWNLSMAQTKPIQGEFYITDALDNKPEGVKVNVYLRQDDLRPPEIWAFFKYCEGINVCWYYMYPAKWSGVFEKYYILDFQGAEHLIFKN